MMNSIQRSIRFSTFLLLFLLTCLSCSDDINSSDSSHNLSSAKVRVQDGYLVFTSKEQFQEVLLNVNKLSKEDLNEWERNLGFVSKRTKINEALANYANATIETMDQIRTLYSDLLLFNDNEFVGSAFPLFQRASLINEKGIVKIGDDLLIFKNDRVITLFGGDFAKQPKAEQMIFSATNDKFSLDKAEGIMISKIHSSEYEFHENGKTEDTSGGIFLCKNIGGGKGEQVRLMYSSYYEWPSLSTGYHREIFEVSVRAESRYFSPLPRPWERDLALDVTYGALQYVAPNPSVYLGFIQQYNTGSQSDYYWLLDVPLFSGEADVADSGTFNAQTTISYSLVINGELKCSGTNVVSNLP